MQSPPVSGGKGPCPSPLRLRRKDKKKNRDSSYLMHEAIKACMDGQNNKKNMTGIMNRALA